MKGKKHISLRDSGLRSFLRAATELLQLLFNDIQPFFRLLHIKRSNDVLSVFIFIFYNKMGVLYAARIIAIFDIDVLNRLVGNSPWMPR